MDEFLVLDKKKFDVVNESEDERREFSMDVAVRVCHNSTAWHGPNDRQQAKLRVSDRVCIRQWFHKMGGIRAL